MTSTETKPATIISKLGGYSLALTTIANLKAQTEKLAAENEVMARIIKERRLAAVTPSVHLAS